MTTFRRLPVCKQEHSTAEIEAYLAEHPEDECMREEAILVYSRYDENLERLKYHTFLMIKYHPSNEFMAMRNTVAFYKDHQYALDVIGKLEAQVANQRVGREIYYTLASICRQIAIPPAFNDEASRAHFLSYFGLSEDTEIPSEPDKVLVEKGIHYYRLAIEAAKGDSFHTAFHSKQLARLFEALGRIDEAIVVIEAALRARDGTMKTGLLLTYGNCLRKVGRIKEAKRALKKVRACDHEGRSHGPGCDTTKAENVLGMIALQDGSIDEACRYLLSSCNVQRCPHNTTQGLPMVLAKKFLEIGQYDAVIEYCRMALSKFSPGEEETEWVLEQALSAKNGASR